MTGMNAACEIRIARAVDATRIALMSRDFIEEGLGWRWTPARVHAYIRNRGTNVVVAETARNMIAFGIMQYREIEAHLLLFGVLPQARRHGVGTRLLRWLEDVAVVAGVEMIFLEARATNTAAREFYRAHGYRELAIMQRYYSNREDAVRIGKDLAATSLPVGRT
jgi:ribosomal-protein-alanine N-acetyltransferase